MKTGPLVFGGWSFGGTVALELARLAHDEGRDVTAVVLLDSGPPHLLRSGRWLLLNELAALFEIKTVDLPGGVAATSLAHVLDVLVDVLRRTRRVADIDVADLQPFVDSYRWHVDVARRPWLFRGCSAPVFLVRARDEAGWADAPPDLGWSSVLGTSPTTLWTPGTHYDLLSEDHAPHLGCVLSRLLLQTLRMPPATVVGPPTG